MKDLIKKLSIETSLSYSDSVYMVESLMVCGCNAEQIKEAYEKGGLYGLKYLEEIMKVKGVK